MNTSLWNHLARKVPFCNLVLHSAWSDPSLDTATRFNAFRSDHCHVGDISGLCNAKCLAFCMVGLITRHCHALQIAMPLLPIRSGAQAGPGWMHRSALSHSGTETPKWVRHVLVTSRSPVTVMPSVLRSAWSDSSLDTVTPCDQSDLSYLSDRWIHSSSLSHLGTETPSRVRQVAVTSRRCHVKCLACRYSASPPRRLLQHQRWQVIVLSVLLRCDQRQHQRW